MCCALVAHSCPTLWDPMDSSRPGSSLHGILQARILEWVVMPSCRGSSQPRDQTQVSHIAGGFLLSEPPGKPKNTGVYCLSLLQGIFLTQELIWGLLHCMRILYQLSYQGSLVLFLPNFYWMKCTSLLSPVVMYGWERKLSTEELMLLNCGGGEDSWESLGLHGDPTSPS